MFDRRLWKKEKNGGIIMTVTLSQICSSLFPEQNKIEARERCASNPINRLISKTNQKKLQQIYYKCSNKKPPTVARFCASNLGLDVSESLVSPIRTDDFLQSQKEPEYEKEKPPMGSGTLIQSHVSPFDKCNSDYINGKINDEEFEKCIMGTELTEATERAEKIEELHEKREERKSLTPWGKFALRIGPDIRKRYTLFKDAFKEWNTGKHDGAFTPAPSNDGTIDKGWRVGTRIALTTEPGLTRWPGSNVLFKGNIFDITIYAGETQEYYAGSYKDDEIYSMDDFRLTLIDFEFQIPLFERNFLELGASCIDEDLLWGRNSTPGVIFPTNLHVGMNWQFQGTPVNISERTLDVKDMAYILSSYTMFGVGVRVAAVNLYHQHKAAEFCNRVSDECKGIDEESEPLRGAKFFSYGYKGSSSDFSGIEVVPINVIFQANLSAHLFGEQRNNLGAVTYRAYADHYPIWKKLEAGGNLTFHLNLGRAMEFYVEGNGRQLWSLEKDDNILLPDSAYELGVQTGLGFRPSQFF